MDDLRDWKRRVVILRRIDRLANGNFGDHKFCQDGVWELRIDFGPGYRVYMLRRWRRLYFRVVVDRNARNRLISSKRVFAKTRSFAAEYLNSILEDGDQEELMLALRRMFKAFGGVQKLAGKAHLNANTLYRTLSPKGNPELKSLRAVLTAMRMQLTVRPMGKRVA